MPPELRVVAVALVVIAAALVYAVVEDLWRR